ncbi:hypothetical protein [Paenibacillus campi]|uniref:hypothetical protein n=1 Tax=Paenibacillus campi TaxID=3106031 RepID=UPI002AFE9C44|nr:hypothetical protein [Paenibacillus sp. SGZ-1014]
MSCFEKFPIGNCRICNQGWVVIVKEIGSGDLFVYCNECEAEWENPEQYLANFSNKIFEHNMYKEPEEEDVMHQGWDQYIDKDLAQRKK